MVHKENICLTINSLGRGGAEKQCLLLAKALQPHHNVTVVIIKAAPVYEPRLKFLKDQKIKHYHLPKNPIKKFSAFIGFLRKRNIEIVFSFLPTDTLLSAVCGKIIGVPHRFGGIRNSYMDRIKFTALRVANNYLLSYTIANNFAAYRSAIDFGFKEKVFVIPNGIETRPLLVRKRRTGKHLTIISLGRLVKQKGYGIAIKSIALLKDILGTEFKFRYKIVGQGPEHQNIEAKIKEHGLEKNIELIIHPTDIYGLLEDADVYLCTSYFEGISNSIMEAMNCSLPVVATDAGDNSRLVIDGKTGFLAAIEDHDALASHLKKLIESYDLRMAIGRQSHRHLVEKFSYETFQRTYLNLIRNRQNVRIRNGAINEVQ